MRAKMMLTVLMIILAGGHAAAQVTVTGNVYGGGNLAPVEQSVTVNISKGEVQGDVYGGGALADTNTGNWNPTGGTGGTGDWTDATKKSALYTTTVNLKGGTVRNVYGGGLGEAGTQSNPAGNPAYVWGDVLVDLNGTTTITGTDTKTYSGTPIAATAKGCVVKKVFGCNNINGSPKGEVVVYVHATQSAGKENITVKARDKANPAEGSKYDVEAVYGGGNQAEYWPVQAVKYENDQTTNPYPETAANHIHTNVIIDGCAWTSIETVYGGGNAASSPATSVTVLGAYEINEVFGGGNGKDAIDENTPNPGAHVGFHKYTEATESSTGDKASQKYGFGKAQVNIGGGTIHSVFGGSNSKGNVREVAVATLDDQSDCDFVVDEAYGGGKEAEMDGRAELNLGCIPEGGKVGAVYGGAKMTNVNNDVVLNITNGTFDAVYGGNNVSGEIRGTITVNVEEKGCTPIIIGKLFGGGNRAAYSVEHIPAAKRETDETKTTYYKNYPQVNVISATRIGQVFGGGDNAAVTGNPHVKIDMVKGKVNNVEQNLGTICQVFGGGNNAGVTGSTYVDIVKGQITKEVKTAATETTAAEYYYDYDTGVYGGCNTQGTISGGTYVNVSGGTIGKGTLDLTSSTKTFIRTTKGNVHGGGYGKDTFVSGNVEVNIGSKTLKSGSTTEYDYAGTALIFGDVYGGGALGHVNGTSNESTAEGALSITPTANATTTVNLNKGTIYGDAYGGGLGDATNAAYVGGTVSVSQNEVAYIIDYDDTDEQDPDYPNDISKKIKVVKSGRIFGCNNLNGYPLDNVNVIVNKTVEGNVGKTAKVSGSSDPEVPQTGANVTPSYHLAAVYGGGNLAPYKAKDKKTSVLIKGCGYTSIETVYGGGNAAAVPETDVLVDGCYEIGTVFGGGNGKDKYWNGTAWTANPGANVGKTVAGESIGSGNAKTILQGGYIHEGYGGSNSKGTISGNVTIKKQDGGECDVTVNHIYGAGKDADVEGDLVLDLGCSKTRTEEVYGCAKNANVKGNVDVIITSGEYGKVFGGNNVSGAIFGHIKVHIEETGCTPIIIDELYGCGNDAAYSVYGYWENGTIAGTDKPKYEPIKSLTDPNIRKRVTFADYPHTDPANNPSGQYDDPEINIVSCTRIGKVFGGGLGSNATVYGNPIVNINQIYGKAYDSGNNYIATATTLGRIGVDKSNSSEDCGVFGGGNEATVEGNTTVNVGNLEYVELVSFPKTDVRGYYTRSESDGSYNLVEGDAAVAATDNTSYYKKVLGANILSNVYGGGNLADVTGNTFVNICAVKSGTTYSPVAEGDKKVNIAGNVFGGGKGAYDSFTCEKAMVGTPDAGFDDVTNVVNTSYTDGNTRVIIGNGTVTGNVYGGGEVGRVEMNTTVMIGTETGTSAPVIDGSVYGAGQGVDTHGYSGLARGNATVTIQGSAWVKESVYGGGEKASVGRYWVKGGSDPYHHAPAVPDGLPEGMPYALKDPNSGKCYVTVKGSAKIGPATLTMPTFKGNVFGGCKGILPGAYSYADNTNKPKRWVGTDWSYFADEPAYIQFIRTLALNNETHVTIGDANDSNSNPFVKGSVYGGSENGGVMANTYVTIESGQIGCGNNNMTQPYDASIWAANYTPTDATDLECPHWTYGIDTNNDNKDDLFAPYDKFAKEDGTYDYTGIALPSTEQQVSSSEGGRPASKASDGHTFYGNVFGGGSGKDPYKPGKWLMTAGGVGGNTNVTINGGHILTSVYGGNELTNVGEELVNDEAKNKGKCIVRMSGGTIGVPRTIQQIIDHPVTCNLFGAGKGDQRVLFNTWTNVNDVDILISGGTIYGSVFGGGEDGHVMRDVKLEIGQASNNTTKIGTWGTSGFEGNVFGAGRGFGGDAYTAGNIGGSVDLDITSGSILGSVYGGGRLASVGYGLYSYNEDGYGRLRKDTKNDKGTEVSYFTNGRGHVDIDITGGTIGNNYEYIVPTATNIAEASITETDISKWTLEGEWKTWKTYHHVPNTEYDKDGKLSHTKGGNVFAGGMGRREDLTGNPIVYDSTNPLSIDWHKLGNVKSTNVAISGSSTWIKSNVYGGGELGAVRSYYEGSLSSPTSTEGGNTVVNVGGGTIGTMIGPNITGGTKDTESQRGTGDDRYCFGCVYGSGYGTEKDITDANKTTRDMEIFAALVIGNTNVSMTDGTVLGSVYGGGELACVGGNTTVEVSGGEIGVNEVRKDSHPTMGDHYVLFGSWRMGNVYGGGRGSEKAVLAGLVLGNTNVNISGSPGIYHNVYGGGAIGSVGTFGFTTEEVRDLNDNTIILIPKGAPTGWSENTGTATVTITGTPVIGINGHDNGIISGSSRGDVTKPSTTDNVDIYDRLGWVKETVVTIGKTDGSDSPDIRGSIYGGGENGHNSGDAKVHVYSGEIGNPAKPATLYSTTPDKWDNRGSVYGAGCGTDTYTGSDNNKHHNRTAGFVQGSSNVNIHGGHVYKSVYGGGSMGSVGADGKKATVNISGGTVEESVYGGPKGDPNDTETIAHAKATEVTMAGGTVKGSVFGGGESGIVEGSVTVSMTGGTVSDDVYGGGALADTNTSTGSSTTHVSMTGGQARDLYGGGLGRIDRTTPANNVEAKVYGDVLVELNGKTEGTTTTQVADDAMGAIVNRVFGANNLNGSPQGNVTVHVYGTQNAAGKTEEAYNQITKKQAKHTGLEAENATTTTYDVVAVYGGGNEANYVPAVSNTSTTTEPNGSRTQVIIEGCGRSSIKTVYGGGNAAAVPESNVTVTSAYEIEQVFGGGNGKDRRASDNSDNPGADIGIIDKVAYEDNSENGTYGTGNANTSVEGGFVHEVYGASNEKGTIKGSINLKTTEKDHAACLLQIIKIYNAGKNSDVEGNVYVVLDCQPTDKVEEYYGGAENAHVKGNVEVTITNGKFGKIFGGNNQSGAVLGHIILNIEETGCQPIEIDELYGCGNDAAYSVYGYYVKTTNDGGVGNPNETPELTANNKLILLPRTSATDTHKPVKTFIYKETQKKWEWTVYAGTTEDPYPRYDDPVVNVISATRIGKVFGGGYGANGNVYGNPIVNINMIKGTPGGSESAAIGRIGVDENGSIDDCGVFGGGNAARVIGNTTINIGAATTVQLHESVTDAGVYTLSDEKNVLGANIVGNVYGGGNLADVTGNTFVNVCAVKSGDSYAAVTEGTAKVNIAGNVFGGGKGVADNFLCDKAMVGTNDKGLEDNYTDGNTSVIIGNGTVNGNVYGGGQIGRVEMNTTVTIGLSGEGTSSPDIKGDVFGGGMGDKEHGYAGLVRGNPTVAIQANAKVEHNVYGGGEIASVARYKVPRTDEELAAAHSAGYTDAVKGRPYALNDVNSGFCTVTVRGNAVIGPDDAMLMTKAGGPDDAGHVFGAGKGIMPENYDYASETVEHKPRCRANDDSWTWFADIDEYIAFIQTLALSSQTTVNIGDANDSNSKPFIKGSVYGGSENGLVQFDTNVNIIGGQIGCGKNANGMPHPDDIWADDYVPDGTDYECASWDYGKEEGSGDNKKKIYAPYDPFANAEGDLDNYPAVGTQAAKSTEGGRRIATDGHTYYGNVFGGGSGSVPYFDTTEGISKYLNSAGTVKGNTNVTISGGHILTSVYGGCEATNVLGTANVTMTGGTVGVPRTDEQILAHPVTCNLFGAGKGDQRVFFNKDTNVENAVVQINGGRIYGSVFGGGEDGHVMKNVTLTIEEKNSKTVKIGSAGTSYMDGNVFGGGRGFGGDALTAGNVGGTVTLDIKSGSVLGSVYGGGRLASVGYGLYLTTEAGYGEMREDGKDDKGNDVDGFKRGYINVNISGGTIGNTVANAQYGGNVFGGSMGSIVKQDGTVNTQWDKFATAKKTTVNVTGGTIMRSVYGGGEMGTVTTDAIVNVSGGTIGTTGKGGAEFGNVYGGGKGYVDPDGTNYITAGIIKGNTEVAVSEADAGKPTTIYHNIYGGGAYGSVGDFDYDTTTGMPTGRKANTTGGKATVNITGGTIGTTGKENGMIFGSSRGDVGAPGSIHDKLAWVYDTEVTIGGGQINGSVYGGGENGHVFHDAVVSIAGGTVGIADGEPITDNNGTPDDDTDDITYTGAAYPYRGNVYGGGCGTDKYYSNTTGVADPHDGNGDTYNPLAGIVYGNTSITMGGGTVVHNVYGAGAMGSVGKMEKNTTNAITFTGGGTTTIAISGGTVGVSGTVGDGNVFGARVSPSVALTQMSGVMSMVAVRPAMWVLILLRLTTPILILKAVALASWLLLVVRFITMCSEPARAWPTHSLARKPW